MVRDVIKDATGFQLIMSHDTSLQERHEQVIYLRRDALDVVYSQHVARHGTGSEWMVNWIKNMLRMLFRHQCWYGPSCRLNVFYEELVKGMKTGDPREWEKMTRLLGLEARKEDWVRAFHANTRAAVIKRYSNDKWFGEHMLGIGYDVRRKEFREKFSRYWEG